jgi:hypothetical protein
MSVPTHQVIWNRHLHIANAFGEHIDLARYVIEVDVTPENGAANVRIRRPLAADAGPPIKLTPEQAADYQACRSLAKHYAPRYA